MRRVLYLGTDPVNHEKKEGINVFHYPIIKIVPRPLNDPELINCFKGLKNFTHFIFTSKNAVDIFFYRMHKLFIDRSIIEKKEFIAVGKITAHELEIFEIKSQVAQDERQEGIIELLKQLDLQSANILMPRSSRARPHIVNYLKETGVLHYALDLYDCLHNRIEPMPNLEEFEEIVFTSPSTVEAFVEIFKTLPKNKILTSIGPVTKSALDQV